MRRPGKSCQLRLHTRHMECRTCLLVDVQCGYASACAPRRDFRDLVHQTLQLCAAFAVFFYSQNNAQNLRNLAQSFHIVLYHRRVAVVVKEDGVCAIADGMVSLAGMDVYGEYGMNDCEGQDVKLRLEKVPNSKRDAPALSSLFASQVLLRGREVRLRQC